MDHRIESNSPRLPIFLLSTAQLANKMGRADSLYQRNIFFCAQEWKWAKRRWYKFPLKLFILYKLLRADFFWLELIRFIIQSIFRKYGAFAATIKQNPTMFSLPLKFREYYAFKQSLSFREMWYNDGDMTKMIQH